MIAMANWLPHTVQLTQSSDKNALFYHFCTAVEQELSMSAVWIFTHCQLRQRLIAFSASPETSWPKDAWGTNDFTHPLAHVFRSPSCMLLDESKLLYWHEHAPFQQMIASRQKGDSVLIQPLPPISNKMDALLVLCGSPMLLATLLTNNEWQCFCQILINQCALLEAVKRGSPPRALQKKWTSTKDDEKSQPHRLDPLKNQLIGKSGAMSELRENVLTVAPSQLSVLILGETGTGKELVARAVHEMSARKNNAMVVINCAAIPENLLETELFGYAKGAFSGANQDKKGLILEADGGTLFLDEIGDMPLILQAKLLRVLETKIFRPVGGKHDISVDFRLISATHVALKDFVEEGKFRLDLYFRLNQFPLLVPALNARKDDMYALALHFIGLYNQSNLAQIDGILPAALNILKEHDFSGNVRELKNLIDYACVLTPKGQAIDAPCFDGRLSQCTPLPESTPSHKSHKPCAALFRIELGEISNLKKTIRHFEHDVIRQRLALFRGDRALAAESLGLPKRTLAHKCLKLEIEKQ